jgi:hypothetical protein
MTETETHGDGNGTGLPPPAPSPSPPPLAAFKPASTSSEESSGTSTSSGVDGGGGGDGGGGAATNGKARRTLATHSSGGESGSDGQPKLLKIVLTGGPCGGKTTALARLSEFFRTHGACCVLLLGAGGKAGWLCELIVCGGFVGVCDFIPWIGTTAAKPTD